MTGTIKALLIIRDNNIRSPREFARFMWPTSEGWHRMHKIGRGVHQGAMMAFAGGGFLGKLRQKGLIFGYGDFDGGIKLSDKGREMLKQEIAKG